MTFNANAVGNPQLKLKAGVELTLRDGSVSECTTDASGSGRLRIESYARAKSTSDPESISDPDGCIRRYITSIASRFGVGQCDRCSREIARALKQRGIHGKVIRLETGKEEISDQLIYDTMLGVQVSNNGYHEGVLVNINNEVLAFDNLHHQGLRYAEWISNLYSPILDRGKAFTIKYLLAF